ncbi:MAG TPA: hypothetical protein PLE92_00715 [Lentisphaeria bacterium]|nr:hypothetical protein [Lentisphaerota bacterium]HQC51626.1 hypothetical protein [Lentisphaeria bacterium]HQL87438.1 hypothetical protein [Lentisphaeria bacterium]
MAGIRLLGWLLAAPVASGELRQNCKRRRSRAILAEGKMPDRLFAWKRTEPAGGVPNPAALGGQG